jgi:GYF domain 2
MSKAYLQSIGLVLRLEEFSMRSMSWYYERGGEPVGPVSEAEFSGLIAEGSITPATLVWREGMANWQAHGELPLSIAPSARPSLAAPEAPIAVGTPGATCQVCGRAFPADQIVMIVGAPVCAACKPIRLQMLQEGSSVLGGGLWRSGKTLVAARDAPFPDRCVVCGQTHDLRRVKKRLYWHHPLIFLTLLAGALVYVIVALVVRKRADIELSICGTDRTRRIVKITLAWLLWLAFLVSFPVLAANRTPDWMWFLPPLLFIAAVVLSMMARLIHARKIDEKHVWIRGVCESFLADLPEWPGK